MSDKINWLLGSEILVKSDEIMKLYHLLKEEAHRSYRYARSSIYMAGTFNTDASVRIEIADKLIKLISDASNY